MVFVFTKGQKFVGQNKEKAQFILGLLYNLWWKLAELRNFLNLHRILVKYSKPQKDEEINILSLNLVHVF